MTSGENALRRSEAVRAKRMGRRANKKVQRRGERKRSVPAMVARNPEVERRLNQGRSTRPRRRMKVNLATEGAELRLPAMPAVKVGWRVLSAGIIAAAGFALYVLLTSPAFIVSRVELRSAARLSAQDLNRVLGLAGNSIFEISPDAVTAALNAEFPELQNFSLHIGFPARVIVEVDERTPALAWQQSGITVWLDTAGVAFIPEGDVEGLPQVEALDAPPALESGLYGPNQLVSPSMVASILTLSEHAPEGATLVYDPEMGFGWNDPEGWRAFFGVQGNEIEQRLAVYEAIVAELGGRNLKPTMISVAQLHAPYYRLDY